MFFVFKRTRSWISSGFHCDTKALTGRLPIVSDWLVKRSLCRTAIGFLPHISLNLQLSRSNREYHRLSIIRVSCQVGSFCYVHTSAVIFTAIVHARDSRVQALNFKKDQPIWEPNLVRDKREMNRVCYRKTRWSDPDLFFEVSSLLIRKFQFEKFSGNHFWTTYKSSL